MKQELFLLCNRNDYYNKRISYIPNSLLTHFTTSRYNAGHFKDINIATGDALSCKVIINYGNNYGVLLKKTPNYAVIGTTDDSNQVSDTHWFVMRITKIRGCQYEVELKRDLLYDYAPYVYNATAFIERGNLPYQNPLIYNKEGFSLNQIKQKEIPLKDKSQTGWIIGYIAKQDENNQDYSVTVETDADTGYFGAIAYNDLPADVRAILTANEVIVGIKEMRLTMTGRDDTTLSYVNNHWFGSSVAIFTADNLLSLRPTKGYDMWGTQIDPQSSEIDATAWSKLNIQINYTTAVPSFSGSNSIYTGKALQSLMSYLNKADLFDAVIDDLGGAYDPTFKDEWDGTIIEVSVGQYQKIIVDEYSEEESQVDISNQNLIWGMLRTAMINGIDSYNSNFTSPAVTYLNDLVTGSLIAVNKKYRVRTISVNGPKVGATIPTTRNKLKDAPYDMFAIPFNGFDTDKGLYISNGAYTSNKVSLQFAMQLATDLGSKLYDLQFLPYMPDLDMIDYNFVGNYGFANANLVLNVDYVDVEDTDNNVVTKVFFPRVSKGNFLISYYDGMHDELEYFTYNPFNTGDFNTHLKMLNEVEMLRFCSPNYASIFEFNRAMNGGTIESFNIMFDYKPYSPFIRVAPEFKGLYGANIQDSRGLFLGGDYSLPIISDAWTEYQIQNKNYQLMFDRNIKHIEITQDIAREQLDLKNFTGILKGGIGTMLATLFGGPAGMIGGLLGTGLTAINGVAQANWQQRQQEEEKSYAIDSFNYTLGNIKALPDTITKVGAINNLYKIFPIIEVYRATQEEENLVENKITYYGYNINATGTIGDYYDPYEDKEYYIKAQVIRFNTPNNVDYYMDDSIARELASEIAKGFYINWNGFIPHN